MIWVVSAVLEGEGMAVSEREVGSYVLGKAARNRVLRPAMGLGRLRQVG
jgi:hypothetical protein